MSPAPDAKASRSEANRKFLAGGFLPIVVLVVLALALFWPATRYGFINFDDDAYVANNPFVQPGLTLAGLRWAFTAVYELWWLPLLWISYMVDVELFGPGPFGFHLTNLLLHAVNSALLFWFFFRATGSKWRSFFVAALFAVHPLRIESVVWITERKDVLSGLFFFLCLLAHLRQTERPGPFRYWTLPALMFLGLLAKSMLVVLPFLLLLLDFWPLRRAGLSGGAETWKAWTPLVLEKKWLFALSAVFVAITLHTHGTMDANAAPLSGWQRASLIAPNYVDYVRLLFWPAELSLINPPYDPSIPLQVLSVAGLLAATALGWRLRKRYPPLLVGWLWFLGCLFPVIRGVRFDEQSAFSDRYTYLAGIGLGLLVGWGAGYLCAGRKRRAAAALVLGLAVLAASWGKSRQRLPDWQDSPTMFAQLLAFAPADPHVNNNYGFELMQRGELEEAMPYFLHAAALRPKSSPAILNYAHVLVRLGRYEELLDWLRTARANGFPDALETQALTGLGLLGTGAAEEALPFLRLCVRWKPREPAWRIELVRALYESGQPEAAQEEIRGLNSLGVVHVRDFASLADHYAAIWPAGEAALAWNFFRNNLRRLPDDLGLLNNAAWLLATTDQPPAAPDEALRLARRAVELAPAHPGILDTLAAALAANGRFEEAVAVAQQASGLARQAGAAELAQHVEARRAVYARQRPWRNPKIESTEKTAVPKP